MIGGERVRFTIEGRNFEEPRSMDPHRTDRDRMGHAPGMDITALSN
jgi:hypothetical protein